MNKLIAILSFTVVLMISVSAQSGGNFTITKSVIADGGGAASGGTFTVNGTAGESVAGTTSAGGSFTLASGFWGGGSSSPATSRASFDYDGDRKADLSVYRPSNGLWYVDRSAGGGLYAAQLGNATDRIVPGDFDGDGKTDFAVYRPSSGAWYVLKSSTNVVEVTVFGLAADVPAPGDYDGDGRADVAAFEWGLVRAAFDGVGFCHSIWGLDGQDRAGRL